MPVRRKGSHYWWTSFTDANGQRIRRSCETTDYAEAKALEAKWRLESHQARHWERPEPKIFEEVISLFLSAHQEKRSARDDRLHARRLHTRFAGQVMNDLKRTHIASYITQRQTDGVSAATINRELALLSSAINYVNRMYELKLPNPRQRLKEPEGRVNWLTRPDYERLLEAARHYPQGTHLADFIVLAVHTGCRAGELLGLEWKRVDWHQRLFYLSAEHTKAQRRRSIPLNEEAYGALIRRAQVRAEQYPDSPWVFDNGRGQGQHIGSVKTAWNAACRRAGITGFRIHDLRHTCAAWLVQSGVPLATVRDVLGHASIVMTERYAHLAPENVKTAVESLAHFGHTNQRHHEKVS